MRTYIYNSQIFISVLRKQIFHFLIRIDLITHILIHI